MAGKNKIVVDYGDYEGLIFLGTVDNETGVVSNPHSMEFSKINNLSYPHFRTVQMYDTTDITELVSHVKSNFEGYVVVFENGFQMKIKLDEYVRLHRLMTNVSNVSVWNVLKNGDNIDSLIEDVPDEFYDWIKTIISDLTESFKSIEKKAYSVYEKYRDYERSYIAKKILHEAPKDIKPLAPIVFSMLDGKDYKETIWKMIRPEYQKPFYQSKDD